MARLIMGCQGLPDSSAIEIFVSIKFDLLQVFVRGLHLTVPRSTGMIRWTSDSVAHSYLCKTQKPAMDEMVSLA